MVAILKSKTLQCQPVYYYYYYYAPQSMITRFWIFSWKIVFTKKKFIIHMSRNYNPSSSCRLLSIVAPSPLLLLCRLRIYASLKNYLFRWSKTRKYFPILQNSHVEHICLVVEPPKVEEKSTWTRYLKKKKN